MLNHTGAETLSPSAFVNWVPPHLMYPVWLRSSLVLKVRRARHELLPTRTGTRQVFCLLSCSLEPRRPLAIASWFNTTPIHRAWGVWSLYCGSVPRLLCADTLASYSTLFSTQSLAPRNWAVTSLTWRSSNPANRSPSTLHLGFVSVDVPFCYIFIVHLSSYFQAIFESYSHSILTQKQFQWR